ncbi:acyl-homoserine-lactone synthase [Pseudothioclava nitratireducens]|uniref:acyl-homoserine-lactone synthase n=1 Tax=Pseudothioclava nitratireducens TaxID=1928646 RepID=UPI0023DA2E49|nr:acyl-homoserine-lactone synthase [Defluviimonas nitratireducens]MDF1620478.1 acyl-homoserine-lactone synthase [Defluviimonas nitratireducens]
MLVVVDALNKADFPGLLDEMFRLRARVFGDRLGWEVDIRNGREIDKFDALDPAYVIGLDDEGHVVSCVRALQTTGPHMLSDVFSAILDGEAPLRSATLWESTRFCVDTNRLDRGNGRNSVSYATCELMVGSLEYARNSGITDIVTVIDPVMDRVLKRSDNAPYGYVGKKTPMGKVPALAALLDCSDERINKVRAFAGIEGDVFADETVMARLMAAEAERRQAVASSYMQMGMLDNLVQYLNDQYDNAHSDEERMAVERLAAQLHVVTGMPETAMLAGRSIA